MLNILLLCKDYFVKFIAIKKRFKYYGQPIALVVLCLYLEVALSIYIYHMGAFSLATYILFSNMTASL